MTAVSIALVRDAKWLTLEVCREFQRGTCSRADADCKFAHPPRICHVENGRVVACFDSLKGRCARENCKYLHPPPHLKTQLEINGRNNLIQQKSAAAMFAQQMQFMFQNAQMPSVNSFPVNPAIAANPAMAYNPYLPHHPGMGLVPAELVQNAPVLISGNPPLPLPGAVGPKPIRSDKLEVCREFQRGRCSREKCKYFHPPAHLQAKLKAAHYQMNHSAAAAMGLQPGTLQLIPKRSALEKVNCAPPVFNPNVFHCQQALPNMPIPQPQPQPQFIPTVPMMHSAAPTTMSAAPPPATSIPFVATAPGNQIPPLSIDELNNSMFVTQM